jgi:hypothetical protein
MSDLPAKPYAPVSTIPHTEPDPQRVGVTRLDPFEHFCGVCGAHGDFGFGGDFSAGLPGLYACHGHRAEVEKRWKRG